ncbi:MAG: hypothetical protein J1G01_06355 [Clostridiales bacterium]|nr:hypothetical protein [Clostridiales bacterium]
MNELWLRIIICAAVVIGLTLYLYDDGANRVYDIVISTVVIVVTSPVFGVLAAISRIKNKRVFEIGTDELLFTFPKSAISKLPFFLLVFIGKRNIMPKALFKRA